MKHNSSGKKVMVFGVFDRLHSGHYSFLTQAAQYGTELIAVIARDEIARELKNRTPADDEVTRMRAVEEIAGVDHAVLGDVTLGSYAVVRDHQPDIICLGYDQRGLEDDLRDRMAKGELAPVELAVMHAHEADRFHTSLLTRAE